MNTPGIVVQGISQIEQEMKKVEQELIFLEENIKALNNKLIPFMITNPSEGSIKSEAGISEPMCDHALKIKKFSIEIKLINDFIECIIRDLQI